MSRKYQIISADGHVETPPDTWAKYVPEKWRDRAPRLIEMPDGGQAWIVEGQPILHNGQNITGGGPVKFAGGSYFAADGSAAEGAGTAAQRLREQDKDGIDAEVLFPPVFATRFIEGIKDREPYRAMVAAYNTFLGEEYCSVAPDRLIGNAVIPVSGIDDAVAELEHVAALGLRSVSLHQFPNGSGFAQPEDDRFWEKALELNVRISPHGNMGEQTAPRMNASSGTGDQPFAAAMTQRTAAGSIFCIAQLIAAGVFDRFPSFQVYFAETNASWLPSSLFFMDDSYKTYNTWFQVPLPRLPSEYVAEHVYFSFIRDPLAVTFHEYLPMDRIMWGTDFPHSVGSFPHSQEFLAQAFAGVDPKIREEVLLTTPAKYFGLDLDAELTPTPAA